jgi:hypothetical protein
MTLTSGSTGAWTAVFFVCAQLALGQAVQVNRGTYHPAALAWLTCAVLACALAVTALSPPFRRFEKTAQSLVLWIAGAGFAYQVAQLMITPPKVASTHAREAMAAYFRALAFAAVLGGAGLSGRPWLAKRVPWLLGALYVYLGVWMIRADPNPFIDVHVFQRDGVTALLAGQNPHAMRYPDIYGGKSPFYGDGLSVNGQLQFGFPYPPPSLFLAALGQMLGGDHRYAQVVCVGLAGVLIAHARPGRIGHAAAALFLFTPRSLFVIDMAWTEPFLVFGLAATVLSALRWPRATPYLLGAFLAMKQYLVLALPLSWLLMPQGSSGSERARWALQALAVACALVLPMALWDFSEFWRSVVALQLHQPFRSDALSYQVLWTRLGHPPPSPYWAFLAASIGIAISLWRLPRTAFGFAAGVCLTFLLFFAFNKQAFCNYYYFVIGALAVAVAALPELSPAADASPSIPSVGPADALSARAVLAEDVVPVLDPPVA